jgi:hypothetical protein
VSTDRSDLLNGRRNTCLRLDRALCVRLYIRRLETLGRTIVWSVGYFESLLIKAARANCGSGILHDMRV